MPVRGGAGCRLIWTEDLWADLELTPEVRDDHAAYIAWWIKVLKNDKRAIFTASSHAQRAADFLHGLQGRAAEDQRMMFVRLAILFVRNTVRGEPIFSADIPDAAATDRGLVPIVARRYGLLLCYRLRA